MAIYKTRNTGTGNGMRGTRGMFTKIPGNLLEDFRGMFKKIPGNVSKDSGEYSRRFRGMFEKIPGNVQEDSGESNFKSSLFSSNSAIKFEARGEKGQCGLVCVEHPSMVELMVVMMMS